MFKNIRMAMSSQLWLKEKDPEAKRDLLSYKLAEVIDAAMNDGMEVTKCWLTVTFSSVGITVSPELFKECTKKKDILAIVNLAEEQLFINAHEIMMGESLHAQSLPLDSVTHKAFDALAMNILSKIYGESYVQSIAKEKQSQSYAGNDRQEVSGFDNKPKFEFTGGMPYFLKHQPRFKYETDGYEMFLFENLVSVAEEMTKNPMPIRFKYTMVLLHLISGEPYMIVTLEESSSNQGQFFLCAFERSGDHLNLGEGKDYLEISYFEKAALKFICSAFFIAFSSLKKYSY